MLHPPKVLVVDDDENILSAFRDFLKIEGCTMLAARSTEEAAKHIEQSQVNLLITDIRLKGQSGVTFFMRMRGIQPDLPVIVITGFPDLITEADLKAYGASYFFLKPLDLNRLREAVRKCLCLDKEYNHRHSHDW
jgi:DNA-binding NtrC family response regulator